MVGHYSVLEQDRGGELVDVKLIRQFFVFFDVNSVHHYSWIIRYDLEQSPLHDPGITQPFSSEEYYNCLIIAFHH